MRYYYICLVLLLSNVCSDMVFADSAAVVSRSRPLLHTFVEIKAWGDHAETAIEEAFAEMERVNNLLNNYDARSEISRINQHAGNRAVPISPETMEALTHAIAFCDKTGGALDITIGPLLRLWGFGTDEVGISSPEPDAAARARAKSLVDYRALELFEQRTADGLIKRSARLARKGMWIDVGSFSKGYVADRALIILKKRGISHALIVAGGTILARGHKPDGSLWQIGIQHPRKPGQLLTVVSLTDCAISTSGDYEIYYEKKGTRRTHIIDPRTGEPVPHLQSVSVIAPDGMTSDALSTSLFVLGPDNGIKLVKNYPGVEALIVSEGGKITVSEGWPTKPIAY